MDLVGLFRWELEELSLQPAYSYCSETSVFSFSVKQHLCSIVCWISSSVKEHQFVWLAFRFFLAWEILFSDQSSAVLSLKINPISPFLCLHFLYLCPPRAVYALPNNRKAARQVSWFSAAFLPPSLIFVKGPFLAAVANILVTIVAWFQIGCW